MTVPGVAWVGLILLLIPVIQTFVQMQWPEQSYAITALVVGVLGVLAKWLEMYFKPTPTPPAADPKPRSIGETGASTPPPRPPSRARRFLIG
jgi:protein-S-isoprenylcysteine O-methyltransferase Ste14